MIWDYFKFAVGNLRHRKLRSLLTVIGIFIGIAAVVALISLSQGMQEAIGNVFSGLGSDRVIISPKGNFGPPGSETGSTRLTEDDLNIILKTRGVSASAGMLSRILPTEFNDQIKYPIVAGIPTDEGIDVFTAIKSFEVIEGRMIKKGEKGKAVVGYELTKESGGTFKKPVKIGKKIKIEGVEFEVIGVRRAIGNSLFDTQVIISLDDLRELTGIEKELSLIHAISNEDITPAILAESITKNLRKSRGVREGNEDFDAQTSEQLQETVNIILNVVQAIIVGIAAISLLVGAIGIMNTMYTSVIERTNEIGIMKSIGAKNSDVLIIFLIESGLLGLIGGVMGVIVGATLAKLVELTAFAIWGTPLISAQFSFWLIGGALLFSFLLGSGSGIFPAMQASKMRPVNALRYE